MDSALAILKEFVITCGIIAGILCILALCFWMYPTMTEVRKMDCAMAEFSPDMSLEVKQACREARMKK
tara:strand:- start:362 stop:565 length:204 start_codon:yes stop_codon:yes gene_type:complete